jgi:hypothetical protein
VSPLSPDSGSGQPVITAFIRKIGDCENPWCPTITGSAVALAEAPPPVVTYAEGLRCRTIWHNGKASYLIQDANVSILVSAASNYSASLHSVWVSVRQDGESTLDIDPTKFEAFADDEPHTALPYLDMDAKEEHDRKHKYIVGRNTLGNLAGASGGAAATPQTATVNNSDGTSSTITCTDPNAQAKSNAQAQANEERIRSNIQAHDESQTSGLLRHTTSYKGIVISGTVYFQGPNHMKATKKGGLLPSRTSIFR